MKIIEIFESSSCIASVSTNLFSPVIKRDMGIYNTKPSKKRKKKKKKS